MQSTHSWIWAEAEWPALRFDGQRVAHHVAAARRAQGIAEGKASALGLPARQDLLANAWSQDALATAAIEGERLNLPAVRSSVARRLGTLNQPALRTPRSVEGLLDMMDDAVLRAPEPLTDARLHRWQAALFPHGISGLHEVRTGAYRDHDEPMRIVSGRLGNEVVHYEAPPSMVVGAEMMQFLNWFNAPSQTDAIVRAAVTHLWFETVHPFEDGNGRVGRALIDMVLARDAGEGSRLLRISQRLLDVQGEYYDQLASAQRSGLDVTAWIVWFVEQFRIACVGTTEVIDLSLVKGRFWAQHSQADLTERQRKVINLLLDAGPAGFTGGMSTQKYVSIARTSRATASRELLDLEKKGALVVTGAGRGTRYDLAIPGWDRVP